MLRACVLEFKGSWERHLPLAEFAYNNSFQASIGMTAFEALHGHPYRSPVCWIEVGDSPMLGLELVRETTKKVALICKRLVAAQSRQKKWVGEVAYRLAWPPQLSKVHDVFHISMLHKCEPDHSHVLDWTNLEVDEGTSYEERNMKILDTREQVLRGKTIPLVKVLWHHHGVEEATWEQEAKVHEKYPDLFNDM
ncbi:uncharacterized protein LOC114279371 [Camellia sinensis]|uniref:uncharacterized protein LOC114279371 n=1 Tax=Camellia sinensis TaxID=4442 RepID=UPI001035E131|nr:uncharacterized protein LOC114279371 [Camellia sinensis]